MSQVMADLAHLFATALRAYRPAEVAAARAALPPRAGAAAASGALSAVGSLQLGHLADAVQVLARSVSVEFLTCWGSVSAKSCSAVGSPQLGHLANSAQVLERSLIVDFCNMLGLCLSRRLPAGLIGFTNLCNIACRHNSIALWHHASLMA